MFSFSYSLGRYLTQEFHEDPLSDFTLRRTSKPLQPNDHSPRIIFRTRRVVVERISLELPLIESKCAKPLEDIAGINNKSSSSSSSSGSQTASTGGLPQPARPGARVYDVGPIPPFRNLSLADKIDSFAGTTSYAGKTTRYAPYSKATRPSKQQSNLTSNPSNLVESLEVGKEPKQAEKRSASWACPFSKHNPERYERVYNSCTHAPGFKEFKRIMEHLRKVHSSVNCCKICRKRFYDAAPLLKHSSAATCQQRIETKDEPEWMSERQELVFNKRFDVGVKETDRWRAIYRTLWPEDHKGQFVNPYYDYYSLTHKLKIDGANSPEKAQQDPPNDPTSALQDRIPAEIMKQDRRRRSRSYSSDGTTLTPSSTNGPGDKVDTQVPIKSPPSFNEVTVVDHQNIWDAQELGLLAEPLHEPWAF